MTCVVFNKFWIKFLYTCLIGSVLSVGIVFSTDFFQLGGSFKGLRKNGVLELMPLEPCTSKTQIITPTGLPIMDVVANYETHCIAMNSSEIQFYRSTTYFPAVFNNDSRSINCATPSIVDASWVDISYNSGLAGLIVFTSLLLISLSLIWWLCTGCCRCGYAKSNSAISPESYV